MLIKSLSTDQLGRISRRFNRLYGPRRAEQCIERLVTLTGRYGIGYGFAETATLWDEKTAVLITYADTVSCDGKRPLATLHRFADKYLKNIFSTIHILPFFPWSSDDDFSVIDYRQVSSDYGRWEDIINLSKYFDLMMDLVLNHVSRQSSWFKNYIAEIAPHRDYFIEVDSEVDLSAVVRPRNRPLLTSVHRNGTEKHLWTTFSDDQIDLNFANPNVLFEFLDILLFYIAHGAKIVRLDAIAYLWKQLGSPCIHLEQTHEIVRLMRNLLDMIAPEVILLTETNVSHQKNISYFGNGDEAHMVYQFSLPPLLLYALHAEDTQELTRWAKTICDTPPGCAWFNFTASHDGIGIGPLCGIISDAKLAALIKKIKTLGGHISTKRNSDGSESPYELNITYFDALGGDDHQTARFFCSQTVVLGMKGVPGVYFHSLTATPNDYDELELTGRSRSINRKKWDADELEHHLNGKTVAAEVFAEYCKQLKLRRKHSAFHPDAAQRILDLDRNLFAFVRSASDGEEIVCISNFSKNWKEIFCDQRIPELDHANSCTDLLSGTRHLGSGKRIPLAPFQTIWLTT